MREKRTMRDILGAALHCLRALCGGRREPLAVLDRFSGRNLTETLARIEGEARGVTVEGCGELLRGAHATRGALAAAAELKRVAGQINVTIHALGILLCLPHILEPGEEVEALSLGAAARGRRFDLETTRRVAEFKFIHWRGGADATRQNETFKDFFQLEGYQTRKQKHLCLLGKQHAVRFLQGARAVESVLSGHQKVHESFCRRFQGRFPTVGDYYAVYGSEVAITDVSGWVSELISRDARRGAC